MWFKNARVYRFSDTFQLPEDFESQLEAQAFKPCGRQDMTSFGWTSVFGAQSDVLHHAVEQSYLWYGHVKVIVALRSLSNRNAQ